MFKNYLKIAFRNLFKGKLFSLINLTGLSIGTAVVILIMLFVKNEWTYDQFHSKSDQIYRAWVKEHVPGELIWNSTSPLILGPELKNNFPEVQEVARYMNVPTLTKKGTFTEQEIVYYVDPAILNIFDFPLIKGKKDQVFENLHQVVITETMGQKYFGDTAPMGQTLAMQVGGEWTDFTVSGIITAPPTNSSLQFDFLIPMENSFTFFSEGAQRCWTCVFGETYVQVDPKTNMDNLAAKIAPFIDDKVKEQYEAGKYIVGLQPLTDIHLNSEVPIGIASVSDARYPYILASVAFLILLLACINFTTLSIGRSVTRTKEVGVRKVTGATKWQLRTQFWSEAIITALIALVIGVVLAQVCLPLFNQLAGQELTLNFNWQNLFVFSGIALSIGLISGIYPAMVLSGFAPIQAIKGSFSGIGTDKHLILRGLVGFQFVLSVFLIICTIGMLKQMSFLQNKNLGFKEDQLVVVPFNGSGQRLSTTWEDANRVQERLKTELAGKGVKNILISSHTFGTQGWAQLGYRDQEIDKFRQFRAQQIDYEYLEVMEMELLAGRQFDKAISTDKKAAIVNESFASAWQLDNPIGATLPGPFRDYQIIGLAKDFNYESLHTSVSPLVMVTDFIPLLQASPDMNFGDAPIPKFSFKIEGQNIVGTLGNIERAFKEAAPEDAFSYTFMDENIDRQYRSEQELSQILSISTGLAILIACLGLFGIATLTIAQRTKEIGVRKILGASTANIVLMLNKNFSVLVIVATLIATPIAWYLMQQWLSDFAYQTDLNIWLFLGAGIATLIISWLSVSYQTLRAAIANPVESIKSE